MRKITRIAAILTAFLISGHHAQSLTFGGCPFRLLQMGGKDKFCTIACHGLTCGISDRVGALCRIACPEENKRNCPNEHGSVDASPHDVEYIMRVFHSGQPGEKKDICQALPKFKKIGNPTALMLHTQLQKVCQ